jgi:Cu-Zn family superoxide dismutase
VRTAARAFWTLPVLLAADLAAGPPSWQRHRFFPQAVATLRPASGSTVSGSVAFSAAEGGVRVSAAVSGLRPGPHGFHVHERGDCSAPDAGSAGDHFDPIGLRVHGGPEASLRHLGDLGNLTADGAGHASMLRLDRLIALQGPASIVGRAVVVHERGDDYVTQPAGNSGARVACGIVRLIAPSRPRRAGGSTYFGAAAASRR